MLEVRNLESAYGRSQVLFRVDLAVGEGEVVTLLGRNGMGKTTTVKSLMGICRPKGGQIRFGDTPIHGWPSYRIAQAGLGLVPEGRQVFPNLTVRENLVATAANRRREAAPWTLQRVFALFPNLRERQGHYGNQLSGGEQRHPAPLPGRLGCMAVRRTEPTGCPARRNRRAACRPFAPRPGA